MIRISGVPCPIVTGRREIIEAITKTVSWSPKKAVLSIGRIALVWIELKLFKVAFGASHGKWEKYCTELPIFKEYIVWLRMKRKLFSRPQNRIWWDKEHSILCHTEKTVKSLKFRIFKRKHVREKRANIKLMMGFQLGSWVKYIKTKVVEVYRTTECSR